jgi:hypothetical protein
MTSYYIPGTIDSGEAERAASPYVVGPRSLGASDPGVGFGDVFSLGKDAFKLLSPETYADITSWLPSFDGVGSSLFGGADALAGAGEMAFMDSAAFGGGTAAGAGLGAAAAAFGPAAAFLAWAQMMAKIAPPDDTSVLLGAGQSENLGDFQHTFGRSNEVNGLHDLFMGDKAWTEGGDPTKVGTMPVGFGSMSIRKPMPYYHVGGAPYENPDLAVSSGRQIARGAMGLPVTHEALPNMYDPSNVAAGAQMMQNRATPVYDAPAVLPGDWDAKLKLRETLGTGEGQDPNSPEFDQWYGGLNDRQKQWADTGMTSDRMYAFTGPNSPDYGTEVTDLSRVPGTMERPTGRPALDNYQWGALG